MDTLREEIVSNNGVQQEAVRRAWFSGTLQRDNGEVRITGGPGEITEVTLDGGSWMTSHVLVVEDEMAIRFVVTQAIEGDPELRATGRQSVDEAVPILTNDPPDLLLTDLKLPGRHGLAMINELENAGLAIPVIVYTAHRAVYEPYLPHHRELTVLEKPVPIAVLLEHIHRKLQQARTAPIGPTFQVADYLQLAAMGRYSVLMRVSVTDSAEGVLEIVDGDVWNAGYLGLSGEQAVAALMDEPAQAVASRSLRERPKTRQIECSTDFLLLELARRSDEQRRPTAKRPEEAGPEPEEQVTAGAPAPPTRDCIRVLVVDDSKLMQKTLRRICERAPEIEVVGCAGNGEEALELIQELRPDVISLDLFMPIMDGVATLKRIMLTNPTPTLIVTSAQKDDLDLTVKSILRFGAVGFVTKPNKLSGSVESQAEVILQQIRKAANLDLHGIRMLQPAPSPAPRQAVRGACNGLAIVSGGTGADRSYSQLLSQLSADSTVALVGVLPVARSFLSPFIAFLNTGSTFHVERAVDGAPLRSGVCFLAGEDERLRLERRNQGAVLRVEPGAAEPGCDPLLADGARLFGSRTIAILLSGEGDPPATGLATIRAAGGITLAQLPSTCLDPECPQRAIKLDLIDRALDLKQIGGVLPTLIRDHASHCEPTPGTYPSIRTRQAPRP